MSAAAGEGQIFNRYIACVIYFKHIKAEAYLNRGIIQLFMKDTRKGCLDLSKAGELGITEAYEVLKRYASLDN